MGIQSEAIRRLIGSVRTGGRVNEIARPPSLWALENQGDMQDMQVAIQYIRSIMRHSCLKTRALLPSSIYIVLAVVAVVHLVPSRAGGAESGSEVVARVNGDAVTRGDLDRQLADPLTSWRLQQELGIQELDGKEQERLALRELIRRQLILQEAGRRNFTVTENELDQALSALRGRFGDLESFGKWMHERGLDDKSLFAALRVGMLTNRVTAVLVEGVRVTDEEVREYYETHKEELQGGEEVRLRIIAVKSSETAEEIMAALRKGESFSRLARERSIGQLAAKGGDTGWIDVRTLPPSLRQIVSKLKAGDVGGPLQKTANEFLLVGLEGRRPLRATSLDEARPEIEQRLLASKQQEAIQAWLTEQEKKSKIEILLQP
jgi:foldase protein PrsA